MISGVGRRRSEVLGMIDYRRLTRMHGPFIQICRTLETCAPEHSNFAHEDVVFQREITRTAQRV